jgi:hypothetical protein
MKKEKKKKIKRRRRRRDFIHEKFEIRANKRDEFAAFAQITCGCLSAWILYVLKPEATYLRFSENCSVGSPNLSLKFFPFCELPLRQRPLDLDQRLLDRISTKWRSSTTSRSRTTVCSSCRLWNSARALTGSRFPKGLAAKSSRSLRPGKLYRSNVGWPL